MHEGSNRREHPGGTTDGHMAASAPPTTSPPQLAGHRPWRSPRRPDCPRLMTEWWESDPSHLMGIEIAADVKAGTGRYRPLIEPLSCRNCRANGKRARMILAVYAGPDGLVWLWTAGYRGLRNHPGETDQTIHTERTPQRTPSHSWLRFRCCVCELPAWPTILRPVEREQHGLHQHQLRPRPAHVWTCHRVIGRSLR